LGIETSRAPTADAGYAYVISNLGLLGFAAFWIWFMSLGGRSRPGMDRRSSNLEDLPAVARCCRDLDGRFP